MNPWKFLLRSGNAAFFLILQRTCSSRRAVLCCAASVSGSAGEMR
jgi:hypothetical protein